MRAIIPDRLWIGNAHDAQDVQAVTSLGIRAVIDLAASEPAVPYPREIAYCRLPLNDGAENDPALLRLAASTTAEFIKSHVPTLVACSAGMSRSPSIVAAALALNRLHTPDDALKHVASTGPHDFSASLWLEIKRAVFSSERPGKILFYEYGTQLRLNDQNKLLLDVLCGHTGQFGVEFELSEQEHAQYKTLGDAYIKELARKVQHDPDSYVRRGRKC